MSQQYERWKERQRLNITRRMVCSVEIVEEYKTFQTIDIIIDGTHHIEVARNDPNPHITAEQLYNILIKVLDKHQPMIESSTETEEK